MDGRFESVPNSDQTERKVLVDHPPAKPNILANFKVAAAGFGGVSIGFSAACYMLIAAGYGPKDIDVPAIVQRTEPAVVLITSYIPAVQKGQPQEQQKMQSGSGKSQVDNKPWIDEGTGFLIHEDGYIVTDRHVVPEESLKIYVTMKDGKSWPAQVVGWDNDADLAVLKIDGSATKDITPLKWGNSDVLKEGDPVVEIGNPLGTIFTVTKGIVSGMHRYRSFANTLHSEFVQFDAATNHGNSGGPVFDAKGQVVAIAEGIVDLAGQSAGLGFATSSVEASKVIADIMAYGSVKPGLAGVTVENATPPAKPDQLAPLPPSLGVRILEIKDGSTAAKSGLAVGDVITGLGGRKIFNINDFGLGFFLTHPKDVCSLEIERDGKKMAVDLVLGGDPLPPASLPHAPTTVGLPRCASPRTAGPG